MGWFASSVLALLTLAPASPADPRLVRHAPLDDVEVGRGERAWDANEAMSIVAAPGERERAAFVVHAGRHGGRLEIDLDVDPDSMLAAHTAVRAIERRPMRTNFRGPQTKEVGRFAPRFEPSKMEAGSFRELWIEVDVPRDAAPGVHQAVVRLKVGATSIERTLRVRVRDMQLVTPHDKRLGMFYRVYPIVDDVERVRRELRDIRSHGVSNLVLDVRPVFGWGPGHTLALDTDRMQRALAMIEEIGFDGHVVVDSGLVPLARVLGHDDVAYAGVAGESLDGDEAFERAATRTLDAIAQAAPADPSFTLSVMHLDEVFERGRLPLFERLAAASRTSSSLRVYASLSTVSDDWPEQRARIDPFVDIRAHHGYSFEWWLSRGGTVSEFRGELEASGDDAWFYHNERGTYFTGRWARLVNGLYLWASPFSCHVTWAYQAFEGSPHDDRDGDAHDFGMSFPDPRDPDVLVPTRIWTALGEGYDDLRHLASLEQAIARHGSAAPRLAARAQRYLDGLRADVMQVPGGIAVDRLMSKIGTPAEAPLIDALSRRYDDAALALMRARVEEFVVALRVASQS